MIVLHHLEFSRSTRVIWLLEELGVPYELVRHQRHAETNRSQEDLAKIHPLAKAPTIIIDGEAMVESGAIIEYLIERFGEGKLAPTPGSKDRGAYLEWLHIAEGTMALPLILKLLAPRFGGLGVGLTPYIDGEVSKMLDYSEAHLTGRQYLVGDDFTGADINLAYIVELANAGQLLAERPALAAYFRRVTARGGYKKAIEIGGSVLPQMAS